MHVVTRSFNIPTSSKLFVSLGIKVDFDVCCYLYSIDLAYLSCASASDSGLFFVGFLAVIVPLIRGILIQMNDFECKLGQI